MSYKRLGGVPHSDSVAKLAYVDLLSLENPGSITTKFENMATTDLHLEEVHLYFLLLF